MSEIRVTSVVGENGGDRVGLTTGLTVGPLTGTTGIGATISHHGNASFTGIVTATNVSTASSVTAATFHGSGANLTGIGGWTHVNYLSLSGGSYTFSSIPTDTSQLIFYFGGLSSDTGSAGSESYPAIRLGTSGGLKTDNYVTVTGYLETSYHYVSAWTSRAILIRENYGRAANAFTGFMTCWKAPNTNKWYMNCVMNRGTSNATDFRTSSFIDLGASITQAQLFLNTGSFDAGSVALSYYHD